MPRPVGGSTAVALDYGAEGVGVLRTEFLFLGRTAAPSEQEQFEAYRAIADTLARETQSAVAGLVGHVAVLYRPASDPERRRIALPSAGKPKGGGRAI